MSIRRQIQALRADKSDTKLALAEKGVTSTQSHGFDHFPNDIRSIQNRSAPRITHFTVTNYQSPALVGCILGIHEDVEQEVETT